MEGRKRDRKGKKKVARRKAVIYEKAGRCSDAYLCDGRDLMIAETNSKEMQETSAQGLESREDRCDPV